MSTGLGTLPRPFLGLGSTMDPQAYNSPTYTYTNIHLYQHTLISTITLTPQPLTTTIYHLPLPFTFSLSTQETQAIQADSLALLLKNCNHIPHHSLSSIETPGVRPLPRV